MTFKHKYEDLLTKAFKELPETKTSTMRFEIPVFHGRIQGNKTIINNISQISKYLGRTQEHIVKFMLRELATTGAPEDSNFVFIGRFSGSMLNNKL